VEGSTENKYATADRPSYNATYSQSFAFSDDGLCNMTGKTSKESEVLEDDLNYTLAYTYDSNYAHRAVQAGKRYYKYDANGNLIREQDKSFADTDSSDEVTYHLIQTEAENVYSTDYAWARMKGGSTAYAGTKSNYYYRDYTWNERNLLSKTKDDSYTTEYLYGGDGQRAVKRSSVSETLYFNKFFTQRYDDAYQGAGGRMSKHIFLGNDRIVTKQVALGTGETYDNADTAVEKLYTYYYHADHLGSTSVVTDHNGEVYERLEYTPYGETWLDETSGNTYFDTPYRFSAKEKDEETGLYYYGARYLDPKYSRWISADPALGDYLPQAPVNDEAKKHNKSLPGQGGVFNTINLNLYHYAGNNPIKYTDPDGRDSDDPPVYTIQAAGSPKDPQRQVDSAYVTAIPSQNGKTQTQNQNKESKTVWAEATFADGPGESSCELAAGVLSVSSELNSDSGPVYGQAQFDLADANFDFYAGDDGMGVGASVKGVEISGNIGGQINGKERDYKLTIGGSLGLSTGLEVKFTKEGFVFDVGFIFGGRLEGSWRKRDEK
jgi:RHS repeat-associated protein